jgi:hypothetical protein
VAVYRSWKDLKPAASPEPTPGQGKQVPVSALRAPALPGPALPSSSVAKSAASAAKKPRDSQKAPSLDDVLTGGGLPQEVAELLKERDALKQRLDSLTGQGPEAPEAARQAACFPLLIHTKETRIVERRTRQLEELRQLAAQRQREKRKVSANQEKVRAAQKTELERRLRQEQLQELQQQARAAELLKQHEARVLARQRLVERRETQRRLAVEQQQKKAQAQVLWQRQRVAQRLAALRLAGLERRNEASAWERHEFLQRELKREVLVRRVQEIATVNRHLEERQRQALAQRILARREQERLEERELSKRSTLREKRSG